MQDKWMTTVGELLEKTKTGNADWRLAVADPIVPGLGRVASSYKLNAEGHDYLLQQAVSDAIPGGAVSTFLVETDATGTTIRFPRISKVRELYEIVNSKGLSVPLRKFRRVGQARVSGISRVISTASKPSSR